MKKLLGYLYAKKQHAKTRDDRAMYCELIETAKEFRDQIHEVWILVDLVTD